MTDPRFIIFDRPRPKPDPTRVEAVNYDTAFPCISARLLFLAKVRFMLALEADESNQQIFLPTFESEAMAKKY